MTLRPVSFIALTLCMGDIAHAEAGEAGKVPHAALTCGANSGRIELNQCAIERHKNAERRLGEVWGELADYLSLAEEDMATSANPLVVTQRAWLAYRDRHCATMADAVAGGSAEPMVRHNCLAGINEARIEELETLLAIH